MFRIITAREAADMINDGDCIAINSFLAWSNPEALHDALYERFIETGSPKNLRLFCSAGFGVWDSNRMADRYIGAGAVSEIVAGHFGSMPVAAKMATNGEIQAYCLPLGVLSHLVRAAASGKDWLLTEVGVGIYCDPRVDTYALNGISKRELVKVLEIEGKEHLLMYTPKIDVAFIKGTTVDPNGNISFEKECLTVDAISTAQAAKRNGGKVIVEVEQVSHMFARPRNVIIPGILVDAVVVCESCRDAEEYNPALSGDVHVPASHMDYYINKLSQKTKKPGAGRTSADHSAEIIGERAALELQPGQIVNLGIGIPENVGKYASKLGILKDIYITVEAGGVGGLPAPGLAFGATIGADMICDMATQFDFYDGGGLDICFLGGLEVDMHGNVNAHKLAGSYAGIGGFANITHSTKTIIFCLSFTTKGLEAVIEKDTANERADSRGDTAPQNCCADSRGDTDSQNCSADSHGDTSSKSHPATGRAGNAMQNIVIKSEGSVRKFKKEIAAISFSGKHAIKRGQRVLYVTERCVFELTEEGLRLREVYPGIDEKTQIRDLLDFELLDVLQ